MTDLKIPEELSVETMPDDPRECCRMIKQTLKVKAREFPYDQAPAALCDCSELVVRLAHERGSELEDIGVFATKPLAILTDLATSTIRSWESQMSDIRDLARHGVGDHRELERDFLSRKRLCEGDNSHRRPDVARVGTDT